MAERPALWVMATTKCGTEHPFEPDDRFCCKVQYMKRSGGLAVKTPLMRDGVSWFDTTLKEQADLMKAECAAKGLEVHQKSSYDR